MVESERLTEKLKEIEEKRKKGEISVKEFYSELLNILSDLKDVLSHEDISENDVKKQIPLLLAFIKDQISKLAQRGH